MDTYFDFWISARLAQPCQRSRIRTHGTYVYQLLSRFCEPARKLKVLHYVQRSLQNKAQCLFL